MAGSAPRPVALTTIVLTPVPGMANFMVSAPEVALASWTASLKVQVSQAPSGVASPVSAVELTVKVVEAWAGWAAIMRHAAKSVATIIRHAANSTFVLHPVPLVRLSMVWFICLPFLSLCGGHQALSG